MNIQIGVRELLSWAFTLISVTLFVHSKIKNPSMQYYMALQGILMASFKKATFYLDLSKTEENADARRLANHAWSDFFGLTQHIMGTMKSIQLKQDLPFDVISFVNAGTNTPIDPKTDVLSKPNAR
jgi:hypothetical protein